MHLSKDHFEVIFSDKNLPPAYQYILKFLLNHRLLCSGDHFSPEEKSSLLEEVLRLERETMERGIELPAEQLRTLLRMCFKGWNGEVDYTASKQIAARLLVSGNLKAAAFSHYVLGHISFNEGDNFLDARNHLEEAYRLLMEPSTSRMFPENRQEIIVLLGEMNFNGWGGAQDYLSAYQYFKRG